jgi:hypothetical protein
MISVSSEPCSECGEKDWLGCQYGHDNPNHFDGVSEWRCMRCGARFGRWTKRLLEEGEAEPPYGQIDPSYEKPICEVFGISDEEVLKIIEGNEN